MSGANIPLSQVVDIVSQSIEPSAFPDQEFHLLSIPALDAGAIPQRVPGHQIGSTKYRITAPCVLVSKINPRIKRIWLVGQPEPSSWICSTEFVPLVPRHADIEGLTASASWRRLFLRSFL
jgi:hypothetical protein